MEFVPFLPINVACKWWEDVKTNKLYPKPSLGMQVTRLLSASPTKLQRIFQKFPTISKGIIVEEVTEDSPASLAGICCNDVIVEFAGETVRSSMELLEATWDKAGKRVDQCLKKRLSVRLGAPFVGNALMRLATCKKQKRRAPFVRGARF